MGKRGIALSSIRWNCVDGGSCFVTQLNTSWSHRHWHQMGIWIVWATHSQPHNANNNYENRDKGNDTANYSNNKGIVIAHRLLDLWLFRFDFG